MRFVNRSKKKKSKALKIQLNEFSFLDKPAKPIVAEDRDRKKEEQKKKKKITTSINGQWPEKKKNPRKAHKAQRMLKDNRNKHRRKAKLDQ